MLFSRSGHLEILKYLLANADQLDLSINSVDANGENALFYASRCDKADIYLYLLEQGKLGGNPLYKSTLKIEHFFMPKSTKKIELAMLA